MANKLRQFHDRHPRFRAFFYRLSDWMDKAQIVYLVCCTIPAVLFLLILYIALPDDVRTPLTAIVGACISFFISPIVLDRIKAKRHDRENLLKENQILYESLLSIILPMCTDYEKIKEHRWALKKFVADNYTKINMCFPQAVIFYISLISLESSDPKGRSNLKKQVQDCVSGIRRQYGLKSKYYINSRLVEFMQKGGESGDDRNDKKAN